MSGSAPLLYRPCVGIVLINAEQRVFVGERIDHPGAWQMPQGGIDEGEDLETAFFRELKEETGTDDATILSIHPEVMRYDFPAHKIPQLYNGKYAGQEQTWIIAQFNGTDADINPHLHNPPEFSRWRWASAEELIALIVPWKRPTYERVLKYFHEYL